MKTIRWGIVSTGNIANQFAAGFSAVQGCSLLAVASRSMTSARAFAQNYGIPRAYGSYEEMAEDRDIDVVYIGTPNRCHQEHAMLFLEAGFPVVCEKPMSGHFETTVQMVGKARSLGLFFMEGMWTRFFPVMQQVKRWLDDGKIGAPRLLFSNFGYYGAGDLDQWRYSGEYDGGALLDVGIYGLSLAAFLFGTGYDQVQSTCSMRKDVDDTNSVLLHYPDGKMAVLSSSISLVTDNCVRIEGTEGRILIHDNWWRPRKAELFLRGDCSFGYGTAAEVFEDDYLASGFQYEAMAVSQCLRSGVLECPVMTLKDTLSLSKVMQDMHSQWQIK